MWDTSSHWWGKVWCGRCKYTLKSFIGSCWSNYLSCKARSSCWSLRYLIGAGNLIKSCRFSYSKCSWGKCFSIPSCTHCRCVLYKVEMEKKGWAGIFEMLFWFAKFWFSLGNRTVNAVWESTDAVFPRLKLRIAIRDTHKDTSRNKPRLAWYLLRFFIIIILGFNFFVSFFRV